MLDGLEAFIVKNQDKNKEKLLPEGTPLSEEAPHPTKEKKSKNGAGTNEYSKWNTRYQTYL